MVNFKSFATDLGLVLLIVGFALLAFSLFEPSIYNKTLTDVGFMLLGLSIQLIGLALLIAGKE